jgi:hypothetical protein
MQDDVREVHRRNEDDLRLRGSSLGRDDAEPVHDDGRRDVQLLHDDERHDGLLLQLDDGHVQVRGDRHGRLLHVHEWRQGLLRDDSGLLRLLRQHDEGWLHLLHDDEWHAGLLLLINRIAAVNRATTQKRPLGFCGSVFSVKVIAQPRNSRGSTTTFAAVHRTSVRAVPIKARIDCT